MINVDLVGGSAQVIFADALQYLRNRASRVVNLQRVHFVADDGGEILAHDAKPKWRI